MLVATGRVRVDGKVATVGQKVDPVVSTISVDGRVRVGVARAYVPLHKPAGVTSTTRDRHAERTVLDLIPTALVPDGTRLYPVGRLDQDSEGLLLLTNDGEWAERVLHPRFGVEREYAVGLRAPLIAEQATTPQCRHRDRGGAGDAAPLRATTTIENRQLAELGRPAARSDHVWYRATLAQGWKRQLRRMFGAVEAPVVRLVRVRIGPVRIDDLASGRVRPFRAPEVRGLGAGAGTSRAGAKPRGSSGSGSDSSTGSGAGAGSGPRPVRPPVRDDGHVLGRPRSRWARRTAPGSGGCSRSRSGANSAPSVTQSGIHRRGRLISRAARSCQG